METSTLSAYGYSNINITRHTS